MISLLYSDALAVPLGTSPIDSAMRALSPDELQLLAARSQVGASLHLAALKSLPPQKATALARPDLDKKHKIQQQQLQ